MQLSVDQNGIRIDNRMNASAEFTLRVQFDRIFKYHKECKAIIGQAFNDYPFIIICSANEK